MRSNVVQFVYLVLYDLLTDMRENNSFDDDLYHSYLKIKLTKVCPNDFHIKTKQNFHHRLCSTTAQKSKIFPNTELLPDELQQSRCLESSATLSKVHGNAITLIFFCRDAKRIVF